jgi:hypothetical protein
MPATVNPDLSRIWDEAETWVIERKDVPSGDITPFLPTGVDDDLEGLGWEHVGLLDASAGIPVTPEIEITHFDAFGHSRYRSKARKGSLTTAFTALEDNAVTRKFVLPGSASNKIGAPKSVYFWILYVLRDEDIVTDVRVSTRPALLELTSHSGAVEGEQEMYEITCHHANDSNGDVFTRVNAAPESTDWTVTLTGGPAGGTFTLTFRGRTTAGIAYNAAAAAVKTALVALDDSFGASDWSVGGAAGAWTVTTPVPGLLTGSGTGLTGGTTPAVVVAPAA